jgi:hypothetical protein
MADIRYAATNRIGAPVEGWPVQAGVVGTEMEANGLLLS